MVLLGSFKSNEVLSTVLAVAVIVILIFASCGSDDDPAGPDNEVPDYTIPSTTTIIPIDSAAVIRGYDTAGVVTLDAASRYAQEISVGDVIIGQNDLEAPFGLLRKVISKTAQSDSFVLETEPATIMETFKTMNISETHQLRPSDISSSKIHPGAKLKAAQGDETFNVELDCVLYDQDGNHGTIDDQIRLDGEYAFTASLFIEIKEEWLQLKKFETSISTESDAKIDLIANLQWEFDDQAEFDLAEFQLAPIPVALVVWLVPTLTIKAHVHGDLTVTFETGISYTEEKRCGFGWNNGEFYDIKEATKEFAYVPPQFTAEFNFETGASLHASCLLYGVAGPYMAGKAGFHFESVLSADPCTVDLTFDLEAILYAIVGIKCDILDLDYSHEFRVYTHPVGEWMFPFGGSSTIVIDPEPDSLLASWSMDGPCSFSLVGSGDDTLTGLNPGEYTLTWGAVSGWITPLNESQSLPVEQTITFNAIYEPEVMRGTVVIDPTPDSLGAPWTLTGPNSYEINGSGDDTLPHVESGEYTLEWGDVPGWTTPSSNSHTLIENDTVIFSAVYEQEVTRGTIVIDPAPDFLFAPWSLCCPNGSNIGSYGDDTLHDLETGEYTLTWGDVSGWMTPEGRSQTLNANDTITFSATYEELDTGTVTDIDGNAYGTVKIGGQWWMAENLKATHYQNGDPLPNVTDSATWGGLKTGAYCNYNNDAGNVTTYGRLYNWYAVSDSRSIAPEGWHVPTTSEWQNLIEYVGGYGAGGKLKDTGTVYWSAPNDGATNESRFSALPGGFREDDYQALRTIAVFWSKSMAYSAPPVAWDYALMNVLTAVTRSYHPLTVGLSVRCVKD